MRCWLTYLISCFILFSKAQNVVVDSLKNELAKAKHDTTRALLYLTWGEEIYMEDPDSAMQLWEKCVTITEQFNSSKRSSVIERNAMNVYLSNALNDLGTVNQGKGDIAKALSYYQRSLKIHEFIDDKVALASILNNLGVLYDNQGNIQMALEFHNRSLKIRSSINGANGQPVDIEGVAHSLTNIGYIYKYQGEISKALEYYKKSLDIQQEIGDKNGIASTLNNIGAVYKEQGKFANALGCYERSLEIQEELEDKEGQAISLANIGSIYQSQGRLALAMDFHERALKIREEIGNKQGIAESLNNLGSLYLSQREFLKAKELCERSKRMSLEIGFPANIRNAAENLSKIYLLSGDHKAAYENYRLFIQMRDSINNEETKKVSIKNQLKYEYEKKAAADSVKVAEEKKVVQAQLKQEQVQRYSLIVGLLLVVVFALFMVNRFRVTNKQKKLIESQKRIVEEQKHLVEEKQREVLDSIRYAKRIQTALVTNEHYIYQNLKRLKG